MISPETKAWLRLIAREVGATLPDIDKPLTPDERQQVYNIFLARANTIRAGHFKEIDQLTQTFGVDAKTRIKSLMESLSDAFWALDEAHVEVFSHINSITQASRSQSDDPALG